MVTQTAAPDATQSDIEKFMDNYKTLLRVSTTRYPVGQTPKEIVWTLNKAKLYGIYPLRPLRPSTGRPSCWYSR